MIEFLHSLSPIGWAAIIIIAFMIFIVLMVKGISIGWGDKAIAIGKKMDNKLEAFKNEIEIENIKKNHDEILQKNLFNKCLVLDDFLFASLVQTVKKTELKVYNLFNSFLHCQYPASYVADIFEDVLMEKVNFNNMKERFTNNNRNEYIAEIIFEIKKNYLIFYEKLAGLHCGEQYPKWEEIEEGVKELVMNWVLECMNCYTENVIKKIKMYKRNEANFNLESIKKEACLYPLSKNKKYLAALKKAKNELFA